MVSRSLNVRTFGTGRRKALALHCTMAHSGAWSGFARALNDEATLIAPDMLSHGRSPDWSGQGGYFGQSVALAADLLTEPMDIVGHSFGAMVALRLAVDQPDLVRSAVLIEPVFFSIAGQDAPGLLAAHDRDAAPYAQALAAGDMARAARLFNRLWATEDSPKWPDLPAPTRAAMIRGVPVVPAMDETLFADASGLLLPGVLDRANMPVMLMCGGGTHPVIPAIVEGLRRRLPDARRRDIDGAGHMLPISHPAECAAAVSGFWRDNHAFSAR